MLPALQPLSSFPTEGLHPSFLTVFLQTPSKGLSAPRLVIFHADFRRSFSSRKCSHDTPPLKNLPEFLTALMTKYVLLEQDIQRPPWPGLASFCFPCSVLAFY